MSNELVAIPNFGRPGKERIFALRPAHEFATHKQTMIMKSLLFSRHYFNNGINGATWKIYRPKLINEHNFVREMHLYKDDWLEKYPQSHRFIYEEVIKIEVKKRNKIESSNWLFLIIKEPIISYILSIDKNEQYLPLLKKMFDVNSSSLEEQDGYIKNYVREMLMKDPDEELKKLQKKVIK